ncbi:MAG: aminotransferase class I/II-fold pyridoxal phosphate-dependent enzyme [Candidatus Nanopelagicales bacterium]
MKVTARAQVPPFAVMEIIAAANVRRAVGQDVLNLAAGEPAAGASAVVRQQAINLLGTSGGLGYTEEMGVPALRAAIAAHHRDWYDFTFAPSSVAVTTGSSGASPWPSWPRSTQRIGSCWPASGTRPTATS